MTTATVFAVVGQHRDDPHRLLLLGEDGRHYAYDVAGRLSPAQPGTAWLLDRPGGTRGRSLPPPSPPKPTGEDRAAPGRHLPTLRRRAPRSAVGLGALLLAVVAALLGGGLAAAHAPALAVAVVDAAVRADPATGSPVIDALAAGETVDLTGSAATGFLEIVVEGGAGWVPVDLLDAGGLTLGTLAVEAPLRAEPFADGAPVRSLPAGGTVLLTGAERDGFLAAAFEGTAGWLSADALTP